ncbi:MAG: hypothetical protein RLN88_06980 [Ekhidna sp.]|uniref:hypothetical protein n=1 Tax=Ekhidna sp. TaxID=2608089 RepID=UPI0032EBBB7F
MTNQSVKPPVWFWVVSAIALLWNLMGVKAYLDQAFMSDDALAQLEAAVQDLLNQTPAWVTAAFAIAVWGGALGSLLLILRKRLAYQVLVVSLIGIIVQMFYNVFMSGAMDVYGPGGLAMPIMILLFGVGLVWFAKKSISSGWIN